MTVYTLEVEQTANKKWWVLVEPTLGAVSQVKSLAKAKEEMLEAIAYLSGEKAEDIEIKLKIINPADLREALTELEQSIALAEKARKDLASKRLELASMLGEK